MPEKRIKALFLDIDEVFTTTGRPEERKVVEETVKKLVQARDERSYELFIFITARSSHWVMREFFPFLKKHGLLPMSELHCENGLYKIKNEKIVLSEEAEKFMPIRETIAKEIEKKIRKNRINAVNASKKAEKIVQVRFAPNSPEAAEPLKQACSETIERLKQAKKIPQTIGFDITKSGINIFPRNVNKGTTARAIERKIFKQTGRKILGKAIGDRPEEDGLMARGKHVKWRPVRGHEEFLRYMDKIILGTRAKKFAAKKAARLTKEKNKGLLLTRGRSNWAR